jgi:hypothetical protein
VPNIILRIPAIFNSPYIKNAPENRAGQDGLEFRYVIGCFMLQMKPEGRLSTISANPIFWFSAPNIDSARYVPNKRSQMVRAKPKLCIWSSTKVLW